MKIKKTAGRILVPRPGVRSKGRRLGAAVLITGLWITAATVLVPGAASADPPGPRFVTLDNSSDPFAFRCRRPAAGSVEGYCLVTSQDLPEGPIDENLPGENYYPMSQTRGYFSPDGLKWTAFSTALTEATLGKAGTKHLWAPAVRRVKNAVGPTNPEDYYLYTPDLTNPGDKYSSKIYVTSSTDPIAGYGTVNIPGLTTKVKQLNGVGYMSDPEVFVDSSDPTTPSTANQYLLWADGDKDSCGGMSLRHMSSHTTVDNFTDPSQAWLSIGGPMEADMGSCIKKKVGGGGGPVGTDVHRPYLEGGSIFKTSNWVSSNNHNLPGPYIMVFAAKPELTPAVCQQPGQPNSDKEVIAYATAGSVTGPWTYQGIIMCGSDSEWTNQATIEEVRDANGRPHLVLVYHDGVNTDSRNRKLRSECLLTDGHGRFLLTSRSPEGAASTTGNPAWCVAQSKTNTVALKSVGANRYVSSPGATSQLRATGTYVGLWEQYGLNTGDQVVFYYLLSRNPGNQWVQVNRNNGNQVMTRGTAAGDWEGIRPVQASGQPSGTYNLKDSVGNFWHVNADGNITASPGTPSGSDTSAQFQFEYLW